MYKFGNALIGFSVAWIVGVLIRMLLAAATNADRRVEISYYLLIVGALLFWAGHWFRKQAETKTVEKRIASVKAKWWGADYGFRVSMFAAALWVVGSFVRDDIHDPTFWEAFGPAIGIVATYFGYKKLVVGSSPTDSVKKRSIPTSLEAEKSNAVLSHSASRVDDDTHQLTSQDRDRAMEELIKRMKSGG